MQLGLLILPVAVPVIFWAAYHYHKDRHLPEPPENLLLCFVLGLIAAAISKGLYLGLEPLGLRLDAVALANEDGLALFAYAMLAIGPIEELAKLLPFLVVVIRLKAFDEPLDGIIYASVVALGFASYENYLYMQFLDGVELWARAVASPLTHCMFASIWGYAFGLRYHGRSRRLAPGLIGLAVAAVLHGLYDWILLAAPPALRPLPAAVILGIWIWRMRLIRRLEERPLGS